MRSFFLVAAGLLATCVSALVAPRPSSEGYISRSAVPSNHSGEVKEYIITFMRNETQPKDIDHYLDMMKLNGDDTVVFESTNPYTKIYIFKMCEEHAQAFRNLTEVNVVEEKAQIESYAQKTGSPWGLQRISNQAGASGSTQGQDFT
jgi:cerevisin